MSSRNEKKGGKKTKQKNRSQNRQPPPHATTPTFIPPSCVAILKSGQKRCFWRLHGNSAPSSFLHFERGVTRWRSTCECERKQHFVLTQQIRTNVHFTGMFRWSDVQLKNGGKPIIVCVTRENVQPRHVFVLQCNNTVKFQTRRTVRGFTYERPTPDAPERVDGLPATRAPPELETTFCVLSTFPVFHPVGASCLD